MSIPGCSICVRLCTSLQDWPAAVLCTSIAILQMAVMDYYLIHHLGISHLTWLAFDAINITLLIITIQQARAAILESTKKTSRHIKIGSGAFGWLAWLSISIAVACKSIVIFHFFSDVLDEGASFFGPNTLKTAIALGSCTFLLLLITQHNAPPGSEGRRYVEELTGTVVFDILDTVDILEVLFDSDARDGLWPGLEELILAVAVLNLLLPTVPLFTLARCKFGEKKLSVKLVHGHRILCVLAVNMPNLLVRLLLWHGMSTGVSPFTLKNILAITLTFYDIYESNKDHLEESKKEQDICDKPEKRQHTGPGSNFRNPVFHENGSPFPTDSGIESPTTLVYSISKDIDKKDRDKRKRWYTNKNYYQDEDKRQRHHENEQMSSEGSEDHDEHDEYLRNPPSHTNTTSV